MRNAKKQLSLVMVAIFTTFIVLSGIPTSAVTKKVTKKVTVTATAKAKAAAAAKAKAAAAKKIADAKKAADAAKKLVTTATKAVDTVEKLTDTDTVDLVTDDAALAKAQEGVTNALEAIVKLNKTTSDYKGLMARVESAQGVVSKAMDDRDAIDKAAQDEKDAAAKAKADADAQTAAVKAADAAVAAVEAAVAAPLVTTTDVAIAMDLGKYATTTAAIVKDPAKLADYTARLTAASAKVQKVVDAATAKAAADAKAKADADAKAAADAIAAKTPAKIVTVSAVDGTITVTFDKKPLTTVSAADFTVTKTVTTATAVTSTVIPTTVSVTSDTAVTIAVPVMTSIATTAQTVAYNVSYTTGPAMTAPTYTIAVLPALAVTSVTTTNLKEALVKFNQKVDQTSAETPGNYVVTNTTGATTMTVNSATLQADGMSVLLSFKNAGTTAKDYFNANQSSATVAVSNVMTVGKVVMTASTTSFTANDFTLPTVTSVALTGPRTVTVKFSEPIMSSSTASASVNSGTYYAYVPAIAAGSYTSSVQLTLGTVLPNGSNTITLAGFKDYAGFALPSTSMALTYAVDTVAPVATLSVTDQQNVVLTFNKPVTIGGTFGTDFTVYHTINGIAAYKGTVTPEGDGLNFDVNFPTPMPSGNINIYLANSTDSTKQLQDLWGNRFATNTTLTGTITQDTTAPVITSVAKYDAHNIDVTFSKAVNGVTPSDFLLKNAAGTVLTISGTTLASSVTHTYRLTTPSTVNGDTYTLTVAGSTIYDSALINNYLAAYTTTFTLTDTTAPVVTTTALVNSATTQVKVRFSKPMATAGTGSIINLANYIWEVGGTPAGATAFPAGTTISAADLGTSAVITFPTATASLLTGDKISVARVADTLGNLTGTFSQDVALASDSVLAGNFENPAATSPTTYTIESAQPLAGLDFTQFYVNGVQATGATLVNQVITDGTNGALITITFATPLATTNKASIKDLDIHANAVTTTFGTKNTGAIATITGGAAGTIADAMAPKLLSSVLIDNQHIQLTYSENLDTTTVGLYSYTVLGNTVSTVTPVGAVVTLKLGTALNGTNVTTSVVQLLGIKDMATSENTLAASTTSFTATDGIAATATLTSTAVSGGAGTLTITFSEPVSSSAVAAADLAAGNFALTNGTGGHAITKGAVTKVNNTTYTIAYTGGSIATDVITATVSGTFDLAGNASNPAPTVTLN